jgi:hypothetical protein
LAALRSAGFTTLRASGVMGGGSTVIAIGRMIEDEGTV